MPTTKSFPAGTVLFRENDRNREMYIIQDGKVRVYKSEKGQRVEICELGKGGIVGEMSLLDNRARSATVETIGDTVVTVVTSEEFEKKAKQIPPWFLAIIRILCSRLREIDRRLKFSLDEEISANVASLLSMLMNKTKPGGEGAAPDDGIDLKFAKTEMVEILSLTPEKVSEALHELEGHKLISVANNKLKVQDRQALQLYSKYRRGTDMDQDIEFEKSLSDTAFAVLKLLYYSTKNLKADKDGVVELLLSSLGPEANGIFSEGEFLKDLQSLSVLGYDEKALLENKPKEMGKIMVNRKKIASVLAQAMFGKQ